MQSESCSPQCTAEPEEELTSLLDNGDDLNKFSSELKRLNEESEERIIQRVTIDIERSEERILKQVTVDNELTIKRITECIERNSRYIKPTE